LYRRWCGFKYSFALSLVVTVLILNPSNPLQRRGTHNLINYYGYNYYYFNTLVYFTFISVLIHGFDKIKILNQ
jgi:hypothetical protein